MLETTGRIPTLKCSKVPRVTVDILQAEEKLIKFKEV